MRRRASLRRRPIGRRPRKYCAEQEAAIEAQRKAAEDLIAEERRKADAAAAEQARIAREKADKDAEAKRLADEAAAAKKKADEANAARQVADREAAEDAALQAAKAAEEARKLEEAKQEAKLEEEARKKQAEEAAAKAMADACAREAAELAQLNEAQEIDAIQALRTHSACASIPAAADRAIKQIAAQKAKLCADDQKTLARVDPKNEEALKATLGTLKCPAIRDTASAQIAKLVDENLRTQKACADEREQLATINLSVPDARNRIVRVASKSCLSGACCRHSKRHRLSRQAGSGCAGRTEEARVLRRKADRPIRRRHRSQRSPTTSRAGTRRLTRQRSQTRSSMNFAGRISLSAWRRSLRQSRRAQRFACQLQRANPRLRPVHAKPNPRQ